MVKNTVADQWLDEEPAEAEIVPLDAQQAQALEAAQPQLSSWHAIIVQALVGLLLVLLATLSQRQACGSSALAGVLAVCLPQLLLVAMVGRKTGQFPALVWLSRLLMWEIVKWVLTLAILLAAAKLVHGVSWPVLLATFIITIKAGWVSVLLQQLTVKKQSTGDLK